MTFCPNMLIVTQSPKEREGEGPHVKKLNAFVLGAKKEAANEF